LKHSQVCALDSSVEIQFQYLQSLNPIIVEPLANTTMQTFYEKGLGYDLFVLDNHGSVARKVLAVIWFRYELWKIMQ
jgi:hypothetical protein